MTAAFASLGQTIVEQAARLASHSDMEGGLTCAYLTPAHRATQAQLAQWMEAAGMAVRIDAIGNVIGRYAADPAVPAPSIHCASCACVARADDRLALRHGARWRPL